MKLNSFKREPSLCDTRKAKWVSLLFSSLRYEIRIVLRRISMNLLKQSLCFRLMLVRLRPEKFENAALFLRLGLPPTLIRTENGGFRKRSSKRKNLKTSAFRFSVDGKQFKNGAFCKRGRHVISLLEFSSNTNPNGLVIVAVLNSLE